MQKRTTAYGMLIISMCAFGSIGIFVHYIPLSSSIIALVRGAIGALFLLPICYITRKGDSLYNIKRNLPLLLLSGAFIGFNWLLLFESYRFTTVSTATLCYYMAPVFVTLFSPLFLKEKLTVKKTVCVIAAVIGMLFVSGVLQNGFSKLSELKGILCGLGAAMLYAAIILLNTKIKQISPYDKTTIQLAAAAVVMLPYCLLNESGGIPALNTTTVILLLIVAILHTGICYTLYFGSMQYLPAQTTAMCSYIDPVIAVILSALLLKEPFSVHHAIGAVLILGAAFIGELPSKKLKKESST